MTEKQKAWARAFEIARKRRINEQNEKTARAWEVSIYHLTCIREGQRRSR